MRIFHSRSPDCRRSFFRVWLRVLGWFVGPLYFLLGLCAGALAAARVVEGFTK